MMGATYSARIVGPVPYVAKDGRRQKIPLGPVLVEPKDDGVVDVIWGVNGQNSTALAVDAIEAAKTAGSLIRLD
jgi:hypothetical protein